MTLTPLIRELNDKRLNLVPFYYSDIETPLKYSQTLDKMIKAIRASVLCSLSYHSFVSTFYELYDEDVDCPVAEQDFDSADKWFLDLSIYNQKYLLKCSQQSLAIVCVLAYVESVLLALENSLNLKAIVKKVERVTKAHSYPPATIANYWETFTTPSTASEAFAHLDDIYEAVEKERRFHTHGQITDKFRQLFYRIIEYLGSLKQSVTVMNALDFDYNRNIYNIILR